jgi:ABC-2 type transport system ATP-binding protein
MGYLPGELTMTERTTARALLAHLVALRDGRGAEAVEPLAERLDLELDRPVRSLSTGTKQKVGLVQAFAHSPELLVLDEPTNGLDPLVRREFQGMVAEARERGATVLLSSHVLDEVQDVADRVSILRAGRVVDTDDVQVLRHRAGQRVEIEVEGPVPGAELAAVPGLSGLVVRGSTAHGLLHGEPGPLLAVLARHHVVRFTATDRELEELFVDFYRGPPPPEVIA